MAPKQNGKWRIGRIKEQSKTNTQERMDKERKDKFENWKFKWKCKVFLWSENVYNLKKYNYILFYCFKTICMGKVCKILLLNYFKKPYLKYFAICFYVRRNCIGVGRYNNLPVHAKKAKLYCYLKSWLLSKPIYKHLDNITYYKL